MIKKQVDNDNFILYSPDSLRYITDKMEETLNSSFARYKELFNISEFRKIEIHYFDELEEFREYVYSLRGERHSLPEYASGTFDKGMIISYISSKIIEGSPQYIHALHMASHELFHIMYKELIYEKEGKERVVWFDEGMAQYFSNEYENFMSEKNFSEWFKNNILSIKTIPNLNELRHGKNFETDDYSGYSLSLLAVKYLYEVLGIEEFKKLMHNVDQIKSYGTDVISKAIEYYKLKLYNSEKSI